MPLFKSILKGVGKIAKKAAPYAVGGVIGGLIWKKKAAIVKGVAKSAAWVADRIKDLKSKGYSQQEAETIAAQEAAPAPAKPLGGILPFVLIGAGVLVLILILILIFKR